MLKLCGFTASNYHNKVRLALLEKGIAFDEVEVFPSQDPAHLARSPMGKLPYLETEHGPIAESQVIIEYLEEQFPDPPLYPRDPFERAKVRELITVLDLHIELQERSLYAGAFFGGTTSDETKRQVLPQLEKAARALARLAKFNPFIAGASFSYADCAAYCHLPVFTQACKITYGRDLLDEFVPQAKAYLDLVKTRPHAMNVNAARKAGMEVFVARFKK